MQKPYELPRATPESQGISSAAIRSFLAGIADNHLDLHGLMLIRHGHVVAEGWWTPYQADRQHITYSLTKSLSSMAIGFAVEEGLLSVEDAVLDYFPEEATEEVKANMVGLKIRHLLTMSTGHTKDTARFDMFQSWLSDHVTPKVGDRADRNWIKGFFEQPIEREPGSFFLYNSGASHMLSALVQRVSGHDLPDYLMPRLFEPLGIDRPVWDAAPNGEATGGWGARLKTGDWARFGQMLLDKGMFNGKRIISAEWIEQATAKQMDNINHGDVVTGSGTDWQQGYGYQFWQCRHGAYRGDGAFGQFCVVLPGQDAVIAINSGVQDMQLVMDMMWEHLLPAMLPNSLPENEAELAGLREKLGSLVLLERTAQPRPLFAEGTIHYKVEQNEDEVTELSLIFGREVTTLLWSDAAGMHRLDSGHQEWYYGNELANEAAAARATWLSSDTLVFDICRVFTPYHDEVICTFSGNRITIAYKHFDFVTRHGELAGERLSN